MASIYILKQKGTKKYLFQYINNTNRHFLFNLKVGMTEYMYKLVYFTDVKSANKVCKELQNSVDCIVVKFIDV